MAEQLKVEAAARNASTSSLAEELIDEGLRIRRHPLVGFRDGPAGRRAHLSSGPDVREVIDGLVGGDVAPDERIDRAVETFGIPPPARRGRPRLLRRVHRRDRRPDRREPRGRRTSRDPGAAPARPAGEVRLLLDTHHSRLAAQRLRAAGHDVTAAVDDPVLASLPDEELLRAARPAEPWSPKTPATSIASSGRAWAITGEHHAGVVFTSPRRYHRGGSTYPANLISALEALAAHPPSQNPNWLHWLP